MESRATYTERTGVKKYDKQIRDRIEKAKKEILAEREALDRLKSSITADNEKLELEKLKIKRENEILENKQQQLNIKFEDIKNTLKNIYSEEKVINEVFGVYHEYDLLAKKLYLSIKSLQLLEKNPRYNLDLTKISEGMIKEVKLIYEQQKLDI